VTAKRTPPAPGPDIPPPPASDPNYMMSLARGLSVIRALGNGQGRRSVAHLATQTGLSRPAVRRCLHTLSVLGYATGTNGTYDLTPAILALGYAYVGSTALIRIGQPVLERVAEQLHESSSMAQLDRHDVVYVARAAMQRILSIGLAVGTRLPAASTSMGRVLVANLDEPVRARYLATVKLVAHTSRTITDRAALRAELDRVRTEGYAIVDQEFEVGLRSVAVPVRGPGDQVVAAINVGVQASRATAKTLQREFLPVLRDAAADIQRALGHGRQAHEE
jgi:IclR family pca regulon transcriptional regulator